jgi:hypothetical protein
MSLDGEMAAVVLGRLTAPSTGMDMEDLGRANPSLATVVVGGELWAGGLLDMGIVSVVMVNLFMSLLVSLLVDVVVVSMIDGSVKTQVRCGRRSKQTCDVLVATD